MSSVNIIADEVDMERKIRLLEIREKMGDKRAFWELRKLRQSIKSNHNSRANQQIRSNPRTQSQQKQKILQVPRRNPKTTSGHISNYITVEASGVGADHDSALRDAFKDAVRKVVGVYVITQSKMASSSQADDLFDEKIYLNADAVVTDYKLLQKTENDGVISIKIKATVVKNDLLKYIKPQKSNEVTDTEIANLLNKVDTISEAEKSLEYILKNYGEQVFTIKKVGQFANGPLETDVDTLNLLVNYEVSINHSGYNSLTYRLKMLLNKICIAKTSGYASSDEDFHAKMRNFLSKNYPPHSCYIALVTHSGRGVNFNVYVIHNKIYSKICQFLRYPSILFQFYTKDSPEPIIRMIARIYPSSSIDYTNYCHTNLFDYEIFGVTLHNRLIFPVWKAIVTEAKFTESFLIKKRDFKNFETLKIKALFGFDINNMRNNIDEIIIETFGKKYSGEYNREYCDKSYNFPAIYRESREIYSF